MTSLVFPSKDELQELLPYLTPSELEELDKLTSSSPSLDVLLMDPVSWILKHFRVPETEDHKLILSSYQQKCLTEVLTPGPDGLFPYSFVLWSDIKKSIKSTIAAAVALWMAYHQPWAQIVIVANDLKQADSRVGFYVRRAIELSPQLRAECKISNYRIQLPNNSFIEMVPIDPTGEAGGNADMVIFSELWGAHEKAKQSMWTEMTLPPAKFGRSFRWVETYAGHVGEAPLLEGLYNTGVKEGARLPWAEEFDPPLEVFRNQRMFALWNTTPRLSWQSDDYYASESVVLVPSEFQRVHRNTWTSSLETFVPAEWWEACRAEAPAWDPRKTPMVVALDAAVSNDCFGMVGVSRHKGIPHVRYVRKWSPPKGGEIAFTGPDSPKAEVLRLAKEHNVICWTYDAYQLAAMVQELRAEGVGWFLEFSQGADRLIADKGLYDAVRDRKIGHNGEPDLAEHIGNANKKLEGERLRIVKKSALLKVDLAVALSMARHQVLRLNAEG